MKKARFPGSPDRPVFLDGLAGKCWLSRSELDWMIAHLPASGRFLEVGSASGVTAARVADEIPGLSLLCLDIFVDLDSPMVAKNDGDRLANWVANRRPGMNLFLGTFGDLDALLPPSVRFDAILVDADHSESAVASDLGLAARRVVDGGVIFAHDYQERGHPGVTPAVDRFCESSGYRVVGQHWTMVELRRA